MEDETDYKVDPCCYWHSAVLSSLPRL